MDPGRGWRRGEVGGFGVKPPTLFENCSEGVTLGYNCASSHIKYNVSLPTNYVHSASVQLSASNANDASSPTKYFEVKMM